MIFLLITVILLLFLGFLIYGSIQSHYWHRKHPGTSNRAEDAHYHFHLIYFNPNDKRILVSRKTGGGYTVNFANPLSILAAILVIGIYLLLILLK